MRKGDVRGPAEDDGFGVVIAWSKNSEVNVVGESCG
jgi:hypothetical protein